MGKPKVYLFSSPTCPHCHSARIFMSKYKKGRDDFIFKELSTAKPEGQKLARKYGIMSVPTFIIKGPNFPQPIGLRGVQSERTMNKYIKLSNGIQEEEETKRGLRIGRFRLKF